MLTPYPLEVNQVTRFLALVHVAIALAAFGIGNAALGRPWNTPALLHLVFGVALLLSAAALWRGTRGIGWSVVLNLIVGTLVALTLILDRVEGATGTSGWLVVAAVAFVAFEAFTVRYVKPFSHERRGLS